MMQELYVLFVEIRESISFFLSSLLSFSPLFISHSFIPSIKTRCSYIPHQTILYYIPYYILYGPNHPNQEHGEPNSHTSRHHGPFPIRNQRPHLAPIRPIRPRNQPPQNRPQYPPHQPRPPRQSIKGGIWQIASGNRHLPRT